MVGPFRRNPRGDHWRKEARRVCALFTVLDKGMCLTLLQWKTFLFLIECVRYWPGEAWRFGSPSLSLWSFSIMYPAGRRDGSTLSRLRLEGAVSLGGSAFCPLKIAWWAHVTWRGGWQGRAGWAPGWQSDLRWDPLFMFKTWPHASLLWPRAGILDFWSELPSLGNFRTRTF